MSTKVETLVPLGSNKTKTVEATSRSKVNPHLLDEKKALGFEDQVFLYHNNRAHVLYGKAMTVYIIMYGHPSTCTDDYNVRPFMSKLDVMKVWCCLHMQIIQIQWKRCSFEHNMQISLIMAIEKENCTANLVAGLISLFWMFLKHMLLKQVKMLVWIKGKVCWLTRCIQVVWCWIGLHCINMMWNRFQKV